MGIDVATCQGVAVIRSSLIFIKEETSIRGSYGAEHSGTKERSFSALKVFKCVPLAAEVSLDRAKLKEKV